MHSKAFGSSKQLPKVFLIVNNALFDGDASFDLAFLGRRQIRTVVFSDSLNFDFIWASRCPHDYS
jgi:hypothetical protein